MTSTFRSHRDAPLDLRGLPVGRTRRFDAAKPLRAGSAGSRSLRQHPTEDGDYFWTADTVVETPRGPSIEPMGVLDPRGKMLCRVTMPIKVKMGFHSPTGAEAEEDVCMVLPEDMIRVSDCGAGISDVDESELCDEEEDSDE